MEAEGYSIVRVTGEHQLQYACNVLNLGDSRIISVHAPSARQVCLGAPVWRVLWGSCVHKKGGGGG